MIGPRRPKSKSSVRTIPVPTILNGYLTRHTLLSSRRDGLMFGVSADSPFTASNVRAGGEQRVEKAMPKALTPMGLHECRHTYASMMIAAGVNAKALSTYMGHSSVTITLDRYGKLFAGNENKAAVLFNDYLDKRLNGAASGAQGLQAV